VAATQKSHEINEPQRRKRWQGFQPEKLMWLRWQAQL